MSQLSSSFSLKEFRPSPHKVYHIDVHPTQPWTVTSDGSDTVVVWDYENRQVLYELNAARVDEKRLVDTQLQKVAEGEADAKSRATGAEAIRGGGVKDVKFFDEDVHYWGQSLCRSAAQESPAMAAEQVQLTPVASIPPTVRSQRLVVMCCEYKVIFLDLVSMKAVDVTKAQLEGRTPMCVEFLPRLSSGTLSEGPLAAIGGSDGCIRLLSLVTLQPVRKFVGGHKGAVHAMLTFMAINGDVCLVSGGSEGSLAFWLAESGGAAGEVGPKFVISKAHEGGVIDIALHRVTASPPQLITCGADKSVAVWDVSNGKELRRLKPVPKLVPNAVSSWQHPRSPTVPFLATVKDSFLWCVEAGGNSAPLCNLAPLLPPTPQIEKGKKLKMYCMVVHPLQQGLILLGSNVGVIVLEHGIRAGPMCVPLPLPLDSADSGSENSAVCIQDKNLYKVNFRANLGQTVTEAGAAPAAAAAGAGDSEAENPKLVQAITRVGSVESLGFAQLGASKSGKYVSVVWPDRAAFSVFRSSDWSLADAGNARFLAWDTCQDRFAILGADPLPEVERAPPSRAPIGILPVSKKKDAAEREASQRAALARAAQEASSAAVVVKSISESGKVEVVCSQLRRRTERVASLQGGVLLGVGYSMARRPSATALSLAASAVTSQQDSTSLAGMGFLPSNSGSNFVPDTGARPSADSDLHGSFHLFSWDTFAPVSPLLPAPLWSAWDPSVEFCCLAYPSHVAIISLRPSFRLLGTLAIEEASSGVWHRRQLFLATKHTVECIFVDAGVKQSDLEKKARDSARSTAARAASQQGELAVLDLEPSPAEPAKDSEKPQLRPPMLQVVRLASLQTASISSFTTAASATPAALPAPATVPAEVALAGLLDTPESVRPPAEVAVGGGGVPVASARLPAVQRRPAGPVTVVGVRDGLLWMIDRFMTAHAVTLSHPGIRCRCLAAYGDPVSAVKWASRLSREYHDDLASFMIGMGYAKESLHLPGISKRLEFEVCMRVQDLSRAFSCLLSLAGLSPAAESAPEPAPTIPGQLFAPFGSVLSSLLAPGGTGASAGAGFGAGDGGGGVLALAEAHSRSMAEVAGVAGHATDFLRLVDTAYAAGHHRLAQDTLRRLLAAACVEGALPGWILRELALRVAALPAEAARAGLEVLTGAMVRAGQGRQAALAAALLGDADRLEAAWHQTGMLPYAALHAQSHGRPSVKGLLEQWNLLLARDQSWDWGSGTPGVPAPLKAAPLQVVPPGRQPVVQVGMPKSFSAAADGSQAGSAAGQPPGLSAADLSFILGGGVQGRRQPLDLSVLEGGRGPAPQKGPPAIAVPLDFSILEKKPAQGAEAAAPAPLQKAPVAERPAASLSRVSSERAGSEGAAAEVFPAMDDGQLAGAGDAPFSKGQAKERSKPRGFKFFRR